MIVRSFILFALCLFTASVVEAAVSISEVAWMGDTTSANHEWIELVNDGASAVAVDGWILSDGMNLRIPLVGTIAGGTYAVLERTSEESAVGPAFLLYTGALVNTGATLVLTNASGDIVDQVTGGADWQNIGGDNVTKETAQYTLKGWVTDVKTPGAPNGAGRTVVPPTTDTENTTTATSTITTSTKSSKGSGAAIAPLNPQVPLKILPEVQSIAYVHQRIPLRATVSGLTKNSQPLVRFEWNFGDTAYASGTAVWHTYEYPGTYAVTVYARYGTDEQMSRQEIIVLPVNVSLSYGPTGEVQLHNDAPYDIDISGYVLRGTKDVVFPPRSIILTRATITVAAKRLGDGGYPNVILYDTKKNVVTDTDQKLAASASIDTTPNTAAVPDVSLSNVSTPTPAFAFTIPAAEADTVPPNEPSREVIQILPDTKEAPSPVTNVQWPYYVLFVVLLIATGALLTWKGTSSVTASDDSM